MLHMPLGQSDTLVTVVLIPVPGKNMLSRRPNASITLTDPRNPLCEMNRLLLADIQLDLFLLSSFLLAMT